MLDARLRPLIDLPLDKAGAVLARRGISANTVTMVGLVTGIFAATAVALHYFTAAFLLIVCNRLLDGIDGAVARASAATDRGGYLDIVADYVFYASIPLAFAIADPQQNALAAAAVLAAFCLTGTTFLAFAAIAAARGLQSETHGRKSFFYSTGLIEGTETILFFLLISLLPGWFVPLAWSMAVLCVLTALQRTLLASKVFVDKHGEF